MHSVRPLRQEDFSDLRELFRRFPLKDLQQRIQNLDPDKLADLFAGAQRRSFDGAKSGEEVRQWMGEDEGRPTVFAALRPDDWHSRFYPYQFGRIAPFLTHGASPETRDLMVERLLEAARKNGFDHLITRVDGAEYGAVQSLEKAGFYTVDSSVKMSVRLSDIPTLTPSSRVGSARVRRAHGEDFEAIGRIAASSHPMNHYYNDPYLESSRSDELFEAWVEKCCRELASSIFVLDRRGRIEGFVVYLHPKALNKSMGTRLVILDFVCLDLKARGGGLGRWLTAESLRRLASNHDMVELRTSHHNFPALSCYQALNMRLISTDFILHRHENLAPPPS